MIQPAPAPKKRPAEPKPAPQMTPAERRKAIQEALKIGNAKYSRMLRRLGQ